MLLSWRASAPPMKLRGLRVDIGYFYGQYPKKSIEEIVSEIISNSKTSSVNTLFIFAYNTVYGAFYPTDYSNTIVERSHGRADIFNKITFAAKSNGLRVVAVVPVNNFKTVWLKNPSWRIKLKNGSDYIPQKNTFLLSAWHPEFRLWLKGFYNDFLINNPDVDGLEAMEPMIDYNWKLEPDYNIEANKKFAELYPNSKLGDQDWLDFRAQGLTDLIGIMNSSAADYKKASYLVQTWPAKSDGSLFSSQFIKDNTGLDLDAILNFTGPKKITYLVTELIWQQWAAEYGKEYFSPKWASTVAKSFIKFVNRRSLPVIHVELSTFQGATGEVSPTTKDFVEALRSIRNLNAGISVYDYKQVADVQGWNTLKNWY